MGEVIAVKIAMLGTGNALSTECYNTCFILTESITEGTNTLLVDTGGGNGILHQLRHAGFELQDIHDIFISHSHIDHLLGLIWIVRISAQLMNKGRFNGDINIYSHDKVIPLVDDLAGKLLLPYQYGFIGSRIHLHTVNDGDTLRISGHDVTFFDIHSGRTKQFGFTLSYDGKERLTFCGDEPLREECLNYAEGSTWLLHEAFCLYSQREEFSPYEKNHSTVKDACETAQRLNVRNLLLYHTEDTQLSRRKGLYTDEGRRYFTGKIFIPDDLETLRL